jgi:hypothetical protein
MRTSWVIGLAAVAAVVGTGAHAATITALSFEGAGAVTFAEARQEPDSGITVPVPVKVGDPVAVTGTIFFAGGGIPANFTGTVGLDDAGVPNDIQAFQFNVDGGATSADSRFGVPNPFAFATLVNGVLTDLALDADEDGENVDLSTSTFSTTFGEEEEGSTWGGTWRLMAPVPEPAAWAMMLLGLAGVGTSLRRRRRTFAAV